MDAADRRQQLLGVKLRALIAEHLDIDGSQIAESGAFAPGAAVVHAGHGWVLLDDEPARRLGAALVWAHRSGAEALHVVIDDAAAGGVLARRAEAFGLPISIWRAEDRALTPVAPDPLPVSPALPAEHDALRPAIVAGGAVPTVEHGVLAGEVRGLEVCRVVDDPVSGATRLEVGVGRHDREAFQMLHGDVPPPASLERIVATVESHRRAGAPPHPLNRLAAERFLRWQLEDDPATVGATRLVAVEPPVPRANLSDPMPCVAVGEAPDGEPVAVVCSVGVDLDLIPFAVDARLATGIDRLMVVTPARDRLPVLGELNAALRHSCEVLSV